MRPVVQLPTRHITVRDTIDTRRELLVDSVGPYCAYCESPITVDLPWSHQVSTSGRRENVPIHGVPTEIREGLPADDWRNFHVICAACDRARSPVLGTRAGLERLRTLSERPRPHEYEGMYAGLLDTLARGWRSLQDGQIALLFHMARQNLIWPQLATDPDGLTLAAGDDTWNLLTYDWGSRSQTDLAAAGLLRLSQENAAQGWAQNPLPMVWVVPNEASIGHLRPPDAADVRGRVKATIQHFNLNYHDGTFRDVRVANRTSAFNVASAAHTQLTNVIASVRGNVASEEDLEHANVSLCMQALRETVRSTGFWTVWARTFRSLLFPDNLNSPWHGYPAHARDSLLHSLLVECEVEVSDGENVFVDVLPGTDFNRLPF